MVITIAILLLLSGVASFIFGMRGKRTDEHPLCRYCGFDLTGKPADSTRCSECGRDVSHPRAIKIGHRQKSRGLLALGTLLVLPAIAMLSTSIYLASHDFDPTPYEPTWWLEHDLKLGGTYETAALAELTSRLTANRLSQEQINFVADFALSQQANQSIAWVPAWGTFIEAAQTAKKLDPKRWKTYALQSFVVPLNTRPTIVQGDPVPAALGLPPSPRLAGASFVLYFDWERPSIDEKSVGKIPREHFQRGFDGELGISALQRAFNYYYVDIGGKDSKQLSLGPHQLKVALQASLFNAADLSKNSDGWWNTAGAKPLADYRLSLSTPFTICTLEQAPLLTVVNPSIRQAVHDCITINQIFEDQSSHTLHFDDDLRASPVRLSFSVFVRPARDDHLTATEEIKMGMSEDAPAAAMQGYQDFGNGSLHGAKRADVIFRPDLDALRSSADLTPAWGEEVIIRNVPVTYKSAK